MLRWRQALPCLCASGWCVATSWPSEPQIPLRVYVLLGRLSTFVFVPLSVIYLNLRTKFRQFSLTFLSSSSFPLFLILKYEMFRFHRLYLKLEISDIFPSRVFEYIQLLGASEGPILRVVDSENWKLGNYKVNGRKGRLGMEPWINSLPTLPRSRFNFRLETRLWIGRKSNSTCAPNIPSSSTKHRPLFVSNFFLRFRIRAPKTVRIFANFIRNRKNRRRSNETLDPLHLKR